jgi:hypothetical protein
MILGTWWKSLFSQGSTAVPSTHRLNGRTKALLAGSFEFMPVEGRAYFIPKADGGP